MDNPVIFVVAAEETTRRRLSDDLSRRFGADYRITSTDSATAALAALEAMKRTSDEVAIIIAAQELPEMTGIAFLDQADDLHPETQRCLLVAPGPAGMTRAVRRAILLDHLDFQIAVPWVSPEEWLYPTVSEALSVWTRLHRPHDEAITIVGQQWAPRGHELRDLLDRSGVPYGFYTADSERGQALVAKHGLGQTRFPVAIHRSGRVLHDPSNEELAEVIGVATQPPAELAEVAIVGAGPAGLAAAVYGSSEGLRTVVVESGALGGQAATSHQILNYPGFPRGVSGRELTTRAYFQALLFGTHFVFIRRVLGLESRDGMYTLSFDNGTTFESRAVIVASGVEPRQLGVPALEALIGRGVFYGATGAEAAVLQGEAVGVVGGGNAAGQATLHLAEHAARVTLIVRGDSLVPDMSSYLIQRIETAENVEVRLQTEVVDCLGERRLRGLVLEHGTTGERETMPAAALFVEIGGQPQTDWLPDSVARDKAGRILTGRDLGEAPGTPTWPLDRLPLPLETSLPGVFAAGDVRRGAANRVAPAVGEGALAIRSVHEYLRQGEMAGQRQTTLVGAATRGAR